MRPLSRAVVAAATTVLVAGLFFASAAVAQSCDKILTPTGYQRPVVGSGWIMQLVFTGLQSPRGIKFDKKGGLLVVEKGVGIRRLVLDDKNGTCVNVANSQTVIRQSDLNHGIELSPNGKTLFASSQEAVFSWTYNDADGSADANTKRTIVRGMSSSDHITRTLLYSKSSTANATLLVSRGSAENIDANARDISKGVSQIRAFDLNSVPDGGYSYASQGTLLGWGLRNSVGVAEHPTTFGVWSVENSADQLRRKGTDIHEENPGEELNYHGILGNSTAETGANYGYPDCFALWDTSSSVPDVGSMKTGSQFALDPTDQLNDDTCKQKYIAPRLTFQAHMAPLDIKFSPDGSDAYISFHGSWNRDIPSGYKVSRVKFANGQPVEAAESTQAAVDILSNADIRACPNGCFRPVGLEVDSQGRVFMSSDSTGDIWVIKSTEFSATGGGSNNNNNNNNTTSKKQPTLLDSVRELRELKIVAIVLLFGFAVYILGCLILGCCVVRLAKQALMAAEAAGERQRREPTATMGEKLHGGEGADVSATTTLNHQSV